MWKAKRNIFFPLFRPQDDLFISTVTTALFFTNERKTIAIYCWHYLLTLSNAMAGNNLDRHLGKTFQYHFLWFKFT